MFFIIHFKFKIKYSCFSFTCAKIILLYYMDNIVLLLHIQRKIDLTFYAFVYLILYR